MNQKDLRVYNQEEVVVFCKTKESFGGYSNMCAGYPLELGGVKIFTSEALYQACRFPEHAFVQKEIIMQKSPMSAKMKGKKYRDLTRASWNMDRVKIMRWSLRVKLLQNFAKFSSDLMESGNLEIVEKSTKGDDFWGTTLQSDGKLVGFNILGRLLMELRENLKSGMDAMSTDFEKLPPLSIEKFLFFGNKIEEIRRVK